MKNKATKFNTLFSTILITAFMTACGSQQSSKPVNSNINHQTKLIDKLANQPVINNPGTIVSEHEQTLSVVTDSKNIKKEHYLQQKTIERKRIESAIAAKSKPRHAKQIMSGMMTSPQYNDYSHTFLNIQDNEKYANYKSNSVKQTSLEPVSTFSIDVDTGSYSNIRRLINSGTLPVKDAVRVEEMLNYFQYSYANSSDNVGAPFITHTETAPNPWSKGHHLLQIGIKAIDVAEKNLPAANLVFLIDVSGSMSSANKLGLLKKSLALMITKMRKQDKVSLVVYAGASGVVLKPTNGNQKSTIINALSQLKSGGSTNGASGIRLAYQVAQQAYIKNGINRIMLATDGDFNVGTTNFEQLLNLVQEKRKTGISLSTLGFGTGNYNDQLMEQLADAANGKYSYIDTLKEAQKVLIDEMSSTLKTVAKDVKIQVEFNPSTISEYRLIGYENRKLNKEDFNNDKVDAGDIGAGHTVTAFYDIVLANSNHQQIDSLRYQTNKITEQQISNELAFVKIRYKDPEQASSKLITSPVYISNIHSDIKQASDNFRFASSIIGFGSLLKDGKYLHDFNHDDVIKLSVNAKGKDEFGYRGEFIQLVKLAKTLSHTAL